MLLSCLPILNDDSFCIGLTNDVIPALAVLLPTLNPSRMLKVYFNE